jgi:hypothetical protein
LDRKVLRKIRSCFIALPNTHVIADIRKSKKYSKTYFLALVTPIFEPSDFFTRDYNYLYDEAAKDCRENWRSILNFSGDAQQKSLFESLLAIDCSQDQDMADTAVKK